MPFLPPNQQYQSTEGIGRIKNAKITSIVNNADATGARGLVATSLPVTSLTCTTAVLGNKATSIALQILDLRTTLLTTAA